MRILNLWRMYPRLASVGISPIIDLFVYRANLPTIPGSAGNRLSVIVGSGSLFSLLHNYITFLSKKFDSDHSYYLHYFGQHFIVSSSRYYIAIGPNRDSFFSWYQYLFKLTNVKLIKSQLCQRVYASYTIMLHVYIIWSQFPVHRKWRRMLLTDRNSF